MHGTIQRERKRATVVGGNKFPSKQNTEISFRRSNDAVTFRHLVQFVWPDKTERWLSDLTGYSPRMCRHWMAGSYGPPADAHNAVMLELHRLLHLSLKR